MAEAIAIRVFLLPAAPLRVTNFILGFIKASRRRFAPALRGLMRQTVSFQHALNLIDHWIVVSKNRFCAIR